MRPDIVRIRLQQPLQFSRGLLVAMAALQRQGQIETRFRSCRVQGQRRTRGRDGLGKFAGFQGGGGMVQLRLKPAGIGSRGGAKGLVGEDEFPALHRLQAPLKMALRGCPIAG